MTYYHKLDVTGWQTTIRAVKDKLTQNLVNYVRDQGKFDKRGRS